MQERCVVKTLSCVSIVLLGGLVLGAGCQSASDFFKIDESRWFDPSSVIDAPDGSPISPIRASASIVDTRQDLPPNAEPPRQSDFEYESQDYVIGPRDILNISVLDLFAESVETFLQRQVSESGFVDLPEVGRVEAEGLTAEEFTDAVRTAYSEGEILPNPTVSVTVVVRRQSTFSILGAVNRPSTYEIIRKDMRLLDAIALAGGMVQTNIRHLLVIRPPKAIRREAVVQELPPLPEIPEQMQPQTTPAGAGDTITPEVEAALKELGEGLTGEMMEPATEPAKVPTEPFVPSFSETASTGATAPSDEVLPVPSRSEKFVFTEGKFVRVVQEAEVASQPSGAGAKPVRPAGLAAPIDPPEAQRHPDPFGWKKADKTGKSRIIAISLPKLKSGDASMNIIVRANDVIVIPALESGEFYVTGNVLRPGVYALTGRKVTVKMAIAASGGLAPLAWPKNSILIRRIGENQEQTIPLNIENIYHGKDSDLYLKPDDVIAVGTGIGAPFLAVLRNAFRLTYGFGFVYDRNFSDPLFTTPKSNRFTRL